MKLKGKVIGPLAYLPFVILGIGCHCLVTIILFPGANIITIPFATQELSDKWVTESNYYAANSTVVSPDYHKTMYYGKPDPSVNANATWAIFIFISALWAVGDAVANTMLQNILKAYFTKWKTAASFANLKVFQALATAGAAAANYKGLLHANIKSWIMLVTYAAAIGGYLVVAFLTPLMAKIKARGGNEKSGAGQYSDL